MTQKSYGETLESSGQTKNRKKSNIRMINNKVSDIDKANELNDHFSSIGSSINKSIITDAKIEDFLKDFHTPIFDLTQVTDSQINEAINNLSSSPSCSFDGITTYVIKCKKTELLPILKHIFNLRINTKTFPVLWKSAKVTPLFKSGDKDRPTNYRPISILPTLGKILEMLIHNQFY